MGRLDIRELGDLPKATQEICAAPGSQSWGSGDQVWGCLIANMVTTSAGKVHAVCLVSWSLLGPYQPRRRSLREAGWDLGWPESEVLALDTQACWS